MKTIITFFILIIFVNPVNSQWIQTNGPSGANIRCLTVSGTYTFVGTRGGGVYVSTNNGTSWSVSNNGLSKNNVYSFFLNGINLFAGTLGGVFLSTNNGATWTA